MEVKDTLNYLNEIGTGGTLSLGLGNPTWGDLIALLAIIVSIIIFICQMSRERKNRNDNQKKTWFLEVVVKPRLDGLYDSYSFIINEINQVLEELKQQDCVVSASDLRAYQSVKVASLFDSINNQLEPFTMMVKSYDYNLGHKLGAPAKPCVCLLVDFSYFSRNLYLCCR